MKGMTTTTRGEDARRGMAHGFTLVEALVVVLITAILMSVALPAYLSAVTDAQRKSCRANLQTISNAVQSSRMKAGTTSYTAFLGTVTLTTVPELANVPVCPGGGTYSVAQGTSGDSTTFKVSCTSSGHGSFQPGVDLN